jgi:hypothetical protein
VVSLACSSDGSAVASGHADGSIYRYVLDDGGSGAAAMRIAQHGTRHFLQLFGVRKQVRTIRQEVRTGLRWRAVMAPNDALSPNLFDLSGPVSLAFSMRPLDRWAKESDKIAKQTKTVSG